MASEDEIPKRGKRLRIRSERDDEEEIMEHLKGKMNAAKLRIAEAEKARAKKLKAIQKEKRDGLRQKELLLKAISQRDAALAKKEKMLKEKEAEIAATTEELNTLHKEMDEMASELNILDNTVTTTEVIILLRHLLYRITPRAVTSTKEETKTKDKAGQDDCANKVHPMELAKLEPRKLKAMAEKVLAVMKQEIDECEAVIYPETPDEKFLGRRGSFYFPQFRKEWPDSAILSRIEIETEGGKELVVPISTNGVCMSEKMFSLLEIRLDKLVETFKSVLERKKKGKKTVSKKFLDFVLNDEDGRDLMEKVTTIYMKALIPPDLVSWLRKEGIEKIPYAGKIMEALKSHSETAFGTAIFENDLKMTREEEKETTKAFVSFLVTSVEEKASKKRDEEVLAKCAKRVFRDVGLQLTDSCLRNMFKAATMYDDDFDIDKSIWRSLEAQSYSDPVKVEEREAYSDEEEEEGGGEEQDDDSLSSGIKGAIDEFDLVFDNELSELEEKFDYCMSQSEC